MSHDLMTIKNVADAESALQTVESDPRYASLALTPNLPADPCHEAEKLNCVKPWGRQSSAKMAFLLIQGMVV